MLKLQPLLTAGVGLFLMLPQVVLDDADVSSLGSVLRETERAIEVLRGIETRIQAEDDEAVRLVQGLTEPPALAGPELDGAVERLRAEVSLLQAELDVIDGFGPGAAPSAASLDLVPRALEAFPNGSPAPEARPTGGPSAGEPGRAAGAIRTGLTPEMLAGLRPGAAPATEPKAAPAAEAPAKSAAPATSPEGPAYSADPIGHARACLLAGRFLEGYALVERLPEPEAVALRARLLERLGRLDEAILALEGVVGLLPDGYEGRRAASDLEFLRWKRDFLARLPGDAR